YKLNGKSISDVLAMNVEEALEYFEIKEVLRKLQAMSDVGLDYLSLGQPLSTLSGGECQRIKLASELHKKGSIYIMDEPTTGLHMSHIAHRLEFASAFLDLEELERLLNIHCQHIADGFAVEFIGKHFVFEAFAATDF